MRNKGSLYPYDVLPPFLEMHGLR